MNQWNSGTGVCNLGHWCQKQVHIFTFSRSEYCHSALSYRTSFCLLPVASSSSKEYVGSGGKNASLAAIFEGQGGQQNKQHNSENESPIPLIMIDTNNEAPNIYQPRNISTRD